MIDVQYIFESVNDLSRKNNGGYTSSVEFNRRILLVQSILLRYYHAIFEETQQILDNVQPFLKSELLPIGLRGILDYPKDYRYKIDLAYLYVENASGSKDKCDIDDLTPSQQLIPMQYLHVNEIAQTLASFIRKPSKEKKIFKYSLVNNKIQVYPDDLTGYVQLSYLTDPPEAKYETTVDTVNKVENYDPVASVNFIWNEQDADNLVDLFLMFKGIEIRESALINWVKEKKIISNNI